MALTLPKQPWRYWALSAVVLIVASLANPWIQSLVEVRNLRSELLQRLTHPANGRRETMSVKVVQIEDDLFWSKDYQHRTPTNRKQLAKLIDAISADEPRGIALDFGMVIPEGVFSRDVKAGDYAGAEPVEEYRKDTDELVRAIAKFAEKKPILLARSYMTDPADGKVWLVGDALQVYGICTRFKPHSTAEDSGDLATNHWENPGTAEFPLSAKAQANISCGHIQLQDDLQTIPGPVTIAPDGAELDSFAVAIARQVPQGNAIPHFGEVPYYIRYLDKRLKTDNRPSSSENPCDASVDPSVVSATCILHPPANPDSKASLNGAFVIVGANWSIWAKGFGPGVDDRDTPIGAINGARIHQNYAEALIHKTYYTSLDEFWYVIIDVLVGAIAVLMFASTDSKVRIVLRGAAMFAILFGLEYVALQILFVFIDMLVPVTGVALHALIERIIEGGGHHPHGPHGPQAQPKPATT